MWPKVKTEEWTPSTVGKEPVDKNNALRFGKLLAIFNQETGGFDIGWQLAKLIMSPLPMYTCGRARSQVMRWAGFRIGSGTMIWSPPILTGGKYYNRKLTFGTNCLVSLNSFFDLAAPVTIGNYVGFSPEVMVLTGTHQIGVSGNRVGQLKPRPVIIEDGVWLGARSILLPGVTVGRGSVVGAGAVVTKDVPANVIVAGVPAKVIREI